MKINLNPFNKDFGNRLWGMSLALYIMGVWGWKEYPHWAKILSALVFTYFACVGTSRFDKEYRKIL